MAALGPGLELAVRKTHLSWEIVETAGGKKESEISNMKCEAIKCSS